MAEELSPEQIAQREADYVARRTREIAENKQREELLKTGAFDQEYEFWTKIISDEVARSRFNEGFEPIDASLYQFDGPHDRNEYFGIVRICGRDFNINAWPSHDANDQPVLHLRIRVKPRKNH